MIPERLLYNRSDPECRRALDTARAEAHQGQFVLGWRNLVQNYNHNHNYNNNNNNNNNYNYNYNYYNHNYNYYNNYYNNYDYDYYNNINFLHTKANMQDGLKAVAIPFGWTRTWIVGELTRIQGDEYQLKGRRITSLGSKTDEQAIAEGGVEVSPVTTYELHRLQILTSIVPGKIWETLSK